MEKPCIFCITTKELKAKKLNEERRQDRKGFRKLNSHIANLSLISQ